MIGSIRSLRIFVLKFIIRLFNVTFSFFFVALVKILYDVMTILLLGLFILKNYRKLKIISYYFMANN